MAVNGGLFHIRLRCSACTQPYLYHLAQHNMYYVHTRGRAFE